MQRPGMHRIASLGLFLALACRNQAWGGASRAPNNLVQFNLVSPGARSLAAGGAFITLAATLR